MNTKHKVEVTPCAAQVTFRGVTWECVGKKYDGVVHDGYHWWEEKGQLGVVAWPKALTESKPNAETEVQP